MKFFLGRAFYRGNYKIIMFFSSWNCSYFLGHNYFTYSQQGTKLLFAIFNFFPWQSCDSICFTLVKCLELQSHHCFFWNIFLCGLNSRAGIMNVNMAYMYSFIIFTISQDETINTYVLQCVHFHQSCQILKIIFVILKVGNLNLYTKFSCLHGLNFGNIILILTSCSNSYNPKQTTQWILHNKKN